jgi:two-component system, chemotaxis family, response regulator PixG
MAVENLSIYDLAPKLTQIKQRLFTGRINLKGSGEQLWSIYCYLGRIVYATGGTHQIRRWVRSLSTNAPELCHPDEDLQERFKTLMDISALTERELEQCWEYYQLANWAKQSRISREGLIGHIQAVVLEVMFDICQTGQVEWETTADDLLSPQLTLIDVEQAYNLGMKQWKQWQQSKLAQISPNRALTIVNDAKLKDNLSEKSYRAIQSILNGKQTLREVSVKTRKSALEVGRSLIYHIELGAIGTLELEDFPHPLQAWLDLQTSRPKALIACIDDSPFVCDRLSQIFQEAGYQFIGIQDPQQAIGIVVANKPHLIFLDLVMPNTNGYEVCSRLRKISTFKDVPIVILTGNDGVIDRVRAKVVGATDFITKPVEPDMVLSIAGKYLTGVAA